MHAGIDQHDVLSTKKFQRNFFRNLRQISEYVSFNQNNPGRSQGGGKSRKDKVVLPNVKLNDHFWSNYCGKLEAIFPTFKAEKTHERRKSHCTAGLQFDWLELSSFLKAYIFCEYNQFHSNWRSDTKWYLRSKYSLYNSYICLLVGLWVSPSNRFIDVTAAVFLT